MEARRVLAQASLCNGFSVTGCPCLSTRYIVIHHITTIVLPGVGGFDGGDHNLDILTYNGSWWSVVGQVNTPRQHAAATNIRVNTQQLDISACT